MPELPEVQALAERIEQALAGASFVRAVPMAFSALKTVAPQPEALEGKKLESVTRRGKFLVFAFPSHSLFIHLSQGGRIEFETGPKRPPRPKFGVARFEFDRDPSLLFKEFGTERKAGWWVMEAGDEGPMAKLGPDPFSPEFERLILGGGDSGRLHAFFRDQRNVAGIGRGYADDILHRAKLSPYLALRSLGEEERRRLLDAVRSVLTEGLEAERRRTGGLPNKLGDHWIVHGRYGTPCPACGSDLRRVSYESHEVTYCPTCQTGGRVLADRRLSRLLR